MFTIWVSYVLSVLPGFGAQGCGHEILQNLSPVHVRHLLDSSSARAMVEVCPWTYVTADCVFLIDWIL